MECGKIAYEAYCNDCNWLSIHGEKLPSWDALPQAIRDHWEAAAIAVEEKWEGL